MASEELIEQLWVARLNEVAVLLETEHGDWHYGRVVRDAAAALAAEKERADAGAREERFGRNLRLWRTRAEAAEAQVAALREALERIVYFPVDPTIETRSNL